MNNIIIVITTDNDVMLCRVCVTSLASLTLIQSNTFTFCIQVCIEITAVCPVRPQNYSTDKKKFLAKRFTYLIPLKYIT